MYYFAYPTLQLFFFIFKIWISYKNQNWTPSQKIKIKKKKNLIIECNTKNKESKDFLFILKFSIWFLLWQNEFYSLSESSDAIEERLDSPKLGGPLTSDVVPNNLYHPMTIFDKFKSSNIIWATPINTFLPSILP